jgi:hypothetical protein
MSRLFSAKTLTSILASQATWIIALAAVVPAAEVLTNLKLFEVTQSGDLVVIEGTWRNVTGGPSVVIPRANSVRIECHRSRRTCIEHIAKLIQPSDDSLGFVKQPNLFVKKQEFRVLEWSQNAIVAREQLRAADVDLRISLGDKTAERTFRETAARGARGANPDAIYLWRLE